ncbi:TPA: hypothetical protein NIA45_004785 [Pseudomonas aeruginosa]|nr:hypothetical protein [Pseudomonas aeruginosa]
MIDSQITQIYSAATSALITNLEFLVQRETGFSPAAWGVEQVEINEDVVHMIVPVATTESMKAALANTNNELNFRKAVQRATEALSQQGLTAEDLPALWAVASSYSAAAA